MLPKSIEKLFAAALAIESESAVERNDVGFTARCMVLATLPHSKPVGKEFQRKNGNYLLTIYSPHGLPYGVIPRLILCWLTTEAVRTKSRTLTLGNSLPEFMRAVGIDYATSGKTGSRTRMREQIKKLFSCHISCCYNDQEQDAYLPIPLVSKAKIWWTPKEPDQPGLFESTLTLSEEFFQEITQAPVPIDVTVLKSLKRSPLAIDLYLWLTYRTFSVKQATRPISWEELQLQFGSEYSRDRDFKEAFTDALRKVQLVYPGANVTIVPRGIILLPGQTSIPKIRGKRLLLE
jgi:Plasmid encoded RepA protein